MWLPGFYTLVAWSFLSLLPLSIISLRAAQHYTKDDSISPVQCTVLWSVPGAALSARSSFPKFPLLEEAGSRGGAFGRSEENRNYTRRYVATFSALRFPPSKPEPESRILPAILIAVQYNSTEGAGKRCMWREYSTWLVNWMRKDSSSSLVLMPTEQATPSQEFRDRSE